MSDLTFSGSTEQQSLAQDVFRIMTVQGSLFAIDAPIRQSLTNLADFFASQRKTDRDAIASDIEAALSANADIFQREERDGEIFFVTSRKGRYVPRKEDTIHTFKRRLYEPDNPLPIDDISVVVTTTRPALTTVEPVFISDYWQRQVGLAPMPSDELEASEADDVSAAPVSDDQVAVANDEQGEDAPVAVEAPVAPVSNLPSTVMTLPNGLQVDLRRPVADLLTQHSNTLTNQLRQVLEADPLRRIVLFGNDAYPEAQIANFGKNDLRRIRDYILESQEPLLDTQIIADVFYHNPRQPDYEAFRFAINYRLSREKDFEFVGVDGARLWSAKGLPSMGSKRVKASEMGQIAGYLEEGFDDSLKDQSADGIRKNGSLSHVLSFFEWEYGILPFTRAMAALLPAPLLPDQRTATLRFESPQHYTSLLVELRYPTGNRGGWIAGLEGFFHDHLVPGALITLARTDDPHSFTLSYEEQPETEERMLVLDDRKNKFAFENVSFYCMVDPDRLPTQQQYGRLRNLKSLPMSDRRKSEQVIEHVFEALGEPVGSRSEPRYRATPETLLMGMNVLRPASASFVQHLLKDGEYFTDDGDTWLYNPPPKVREDSDDDEYDDEYDD